MTLKRNAASFRDPSGYIFEKNDIVYRAVSDQYISNYNLLMDSGLYNELTKKGLLISHQETKINTSDKNIVKVIAPRKIHFISYPYEWTYGQLKDAALATLKIQQISMRYGMSLKDATPFNIQYVDGKACLIDTLSFEKWTNNKPWVPYKQFCEQFLSPLAIAALCDVRILSLQQNMIDGIPLDFAASLLPIRARFKLGIIIHILLHAKAQNKFKKGNRYLSRPVSFGASTLTGLIESLKNTVLSLNLKNQEGKWGTYYQDCIGSAKYLQQKQEFIEQFVQESNPKVVWDIGANIGKFSHLIGRKNIEVISIDGDSISVEKNYRLCKNEKVNSVLPLIIDICSPTPSIGWGNKERLSLIQRGPADLIIALALIHHLAIAKNIPFEYISSLFASCSKWLVIEFVPKDDENVKTMLSSREDIFNKYSKEEFEIEFRKHFNILNIQPLLDSNRTLYFMKKINENVIK